MKKAQISPFFWITLAKIVSGAIIAIIAFGIIMNAGPQKVAEASSKKFFEDLEKKISQIDDVPEPIAEGYIDNDVWLIGYSSEQGYSRPTECGRSTNSCICICYDDDCEDLISCRAYPESKISEIVFIENGNEDILEIEGADSITARVTLSNKKLTLERLADT